MIMSFTGFFFTACEIYLYIHCSCYVIIMLYLYYVNVFVDSSIPFLLKIM